MKGSLLSFVLVLLIISPFLCAIIMKKNNSVEFRKLWADNRFNRGLLVSMIVIKVLICIIIVMGIIIRLFNVALGSGLILSFPVSYTHLSTRLLKILGETGNNVMMRLMGLILMVIAVEWFRNGMQPVLTDILRQAHACP